MPRYSEDYEKKLINLRSGDVDALRRHYPNVAYNAIIRSLVEQFVDALESNTNPTLQFDPHKLQIK